MCRDRRAGAGTQSLKKTTKKRESGRESFVISTD